jgi:hypothetical protein
MPLSEAELQELRKLPNMIYESRCQFQEQEEAYCEMKRQSEKLQESLRLEKSKALIVVIKGSPQFPAKLQLHTDHQKHAAVDTYLEQHEPYQKLKKELHEVTEKLNLLRQEKKTMEHELGFLLDRMEVFRMIVRN